MSLPYTLPLHKTYALVSKQKLTQLDSDETDHLKLLATLSDDHLDKIFDYNLFLNSTDILSVLRGKLVNYKNDYITIVSPDLFNIYLNNKNVLNNNDLLDVHKYMADDPPQFNNIVDYEQLIDYTGSKEIESQLKTPIYQLIGEINPYNVLHISVPEFIRLIGNNKPIITNLRNTKLLVSLTYEAYDFYDLVEETVDQRIE